MLQKALVQLAAQEDKVLEIWKNFTREERLPYLKTIVSTYLKTIKDRGDDENRSPEEAIFETAVLRSLKTRFSWMKTKEDASMLEGILSLGRQASRKIDQVSNKEATGIDVQRSHKTYTLLWPVFQKAQEKVQEAESSDDDEEEHEPSTTQKEVDFTDLFERIIGAFSVIMNFTLSKDMLSFSCDGPACLNQEADVAQFKRCGQCRGPRYCTRECQVAHWKQGHKAQCSRMKAEIVAANANPEIANDTCNAVISSV